MAPVGIFGIVLLLIGTIRGFPSFDNTGKLQPRFQCLQSCLTTSEYNPVCSSDIVSYDNESKLNCAIQCGLNIQLAYTGKCRRPPRESLPSLSSTISE